MQLCNGCNRYKDVTEYYKDGHGGIRKQCKKCTTERDKQWREANAERCRAQKKEERTRNKGRYSKYSIERNRRVKDMPGELPENYWDMMINHYGARCMYPDCNKEITVSNPLTHDHVIPVSWPDSTHDLRNSQILCLHHNCSKSNRHATDYRDWISAGVLVEKDTIEWIV